MVGGQGPPPAIQQHITRSERAHSLCRRGEMGLSRLAAACGGSAACPQVPTPLLLLLQQQWQFRIPTMHTESGGEDDARARRLASSHVVVILITTVVSRPVPIPVADATGQRPAERGRRWRPLADSKGPQRAVSADPSDCDWAKASHTSLEGGLVETGYEMTAKVRARARRRRAATPVFARADCSVIELYL